MELKDLPTVFRILRRQRIRTGPASVTEISEKNHRDPYRVLVSCLISLRTKDEVTSAASERLFLLADTPEQMVKIPPETIADRIYPAGFYRTKARTILDASQELIDRFDGRVPGTVEELVSIRGVGRKTANLVVTLGHGKPGICVDTHVHRITNRWGLVRTKNPDQTEVALRKVLPKRYWIPINDLLVNYGKSICRPISPHCTECKLTPFCEKEGVTRFR